MNSHPFQFFRCKLGNVAVTVSACLLVMSLQRVRADDVRPDPSNENRDHQDLSYFVDHDGNRQPIKTRKDWAKRRQHILAQMQTVMGPLPKPEKPIPLDAKTLEEIAMEGRDEFLEAGGEKYAYIPCLNDSDDGMKVIESVVRRELSGWID